MDENSKNVDQPSSSKKEDQRESLHELYDKKGKFDERGDDRASNSESFTSGSYSGRSLIEMDGARMEIQKQPVIKQEIKAPEKKPAGRRQAGRVVKRANAKRAATRKAPTKRRPRRERPMSASTIFTRLSSPSESRSAGCKFCGHRCCRRRYEYKMRRAGRRYRRVKRNFKRSPRTPRTQKNKFARKRGTKAIQVGSRCMMLSPLYVGGNSTPANELVIDKLCYCEVTPEMIYQSLRRLTMWRHSVMTYTILSDVMKNYPVNNNEVELLAELDEKLNIAAVVGIVTRVEENRWCLSCAIDDRKLWQTHVTRFWKLYGDTMTPISRQQRKESNIFCA